MSGTANDALWPDGKWGDVENVLLCGGERLCVYLFTALKVATLCPLVLPVTLGYRQDRALELKEVKSWVLDCVIVGCKKEGASWR